MLQTRFNQVKSWIQGKSFEITSPASKNMVQELFSEVDALQWCAEFSAILEYKTDGTVKLDFYTYGYQCELEAPTLVKAVTEAKQEVERIGKHFEEEDMEDEE